MENNDKANSSKQTNGQATIFLFIWLTGTIIFVIGMIRVIWFSGNEWLPLIGIFTIVASRIYEWVMKRSNRS